MPKKKTKEFRTTPEATQKYWVSWYSGNYEDEGCTAPPFEFWVTGQTMGRDQKWNPTTKQMEKEDEDSDRDECSICAMIIANNEDEIWKVVNQHFPDYRVRFCEMRDASYDPRDNSRFQ